jgi:hypothetical protein
MHNDDNFKGGHIDIVGVIAGNQMFLGHTDIDGTPYSAKRFRQIATLLMTLAWEFEEEADKYDNFKPRCFENSLGDRFFEVAPDMFVDADDRQEAEVLFLSNSLTTTESELRGYYQDLQEVSE